MNDKRRHSDNLRTSVLALVAVLAAGVAVLSRVAIDPSPQLPLHLPAWVAFAGLLLAGSSLLALEVGANAFAISLTEIPVVVCLLAMPRGSMIAAGTLGVAVSLLRSRRRAAPLKLLFNTTLIAFEMAVAAAVFDSLVDAPDPAASRTWFGFVVAMVAANLSSGLAVNLVMALAGDAPRPGQALRHSGLGALNAIVATTLTLLAVMNLRVAPISAIPLLFLAGTSIIPLRRHARLQRRYDGLLLLHEFTAGLTGSTDLHTTLDSVLAETARVLRASDASIVLPRDGDAFRLTLQPGGQLVPQHDDALWRHLFGRGMPTCLPRGSAGLDNYLRANRVQDLMAIPLVHSEKVIGALVVRDRLGEISTFDDDDLAIFATMANQTTVTLENLRLIDRLRDESAQRERQALHDELTGLPNRAQLYAVLDERLLDGPTAVVMVDLNRFKEVNDTLGHHAGDQVLVQTGQRLRKALPASALVARLGGDEFAVVLGGIATPADALARLAPIEMAFSEPFRLDSMSLRIDASCGIAVSPGHGNDRGALLRRADVAMYAAKQVRGSSVRLYDPGQERSSKRSLEIVSELRDAIASGAIDLVFQPKSRLQTGEVIGAEALARWQHSSFGVVSPDEFVPLAEQAGLTEALTGVVLRKSLAVSADLRRLGAELTMAVNIDAQTLLASGFTDAVLGALADADLEASALTIEITERELVRELAGATSVIDVLRAAGIALSIDDFGTGYSSLAYLTRLPVDEVKIDRTFVRDLTSSRVHEAIVRAICNITDELGATTVAEGVEDAPTYSALRSLGCSAAQGYFIARPMPAHALPAWLASAHDVTAQTHPSVRAS